MEEKTQEPIYISLSRELCTSDEGQMELRRLSNMPISIDVPITLRLPDYTQETFLSRKAVLTMIEYSFLWYWTQDQGHDENYQKRLMRLKSLAHQAQREEEVRQAMGALIEKLKEYIL